MTTKTSQQQRQQGKGGEEQQKEKEEEEHLICKECAEIITEFTRKKKKKEERVECPKCGKQVTIPKSGFVGVNSFTRVSFIKTKTTETTTTTRDGRDLHILQESESEKWSDVCLSCVHEVHSLQKKMKHTAEMKNMIEESGKREETECKIHREEGGGGGEKKMKLFCEKRSSSCVFSLSSL